MSMMIDAQQHYPYIIQRRYILIIITARHAPDHLPSAPLPRSAQYDWLIFNTLRVTMVIKIRGDFKSEVMFIHTMQLIIKVLTVYNFYNCSPVHYFGK